MQEERKQDGDKSPKPNMCSNSELFQYLRGSDRLLLVLGSIAALFAGFTMPAFVFFFGSLTDSFDPQKKADDTLSKS